MRSALLPFLIVSVLLCGCALQRPPHVLQLEAFQHRIDAFRMAMDELASSPELSPTTVGIAVWSMDRRDWLYLHNADKLFVPASNVKLLVAISALRVYGPAWRFATTVAVDASIADSVVSGPVYLIAGGAPDLRSSDLSILADLLWASGIRAIRGPIVIDATRFDSTAFGPGWMWDEGPYSYNAPLSAAMLNDNTVTVTVRPGVNAGDSVRVAVTPQYAGVPVDIRATTRQDTASGERLTVERPGSTIVVRGTMSKSSGPVTVRRTVSDPPAYLAHCFIGELKRAGIAVQDSVVFGAAPRTGLVARATVYSAPMDVLVRRFLKQSHNLTGEALLKHLGVTYRGEGSWPAGLSAIREIVQEYAGIDSMSYRLADGSGLSRYTEMSPRQITRLLRVAVDDFTISPEVVAALPIAGVDGTLSRRLSDGPESGLVRGKTGAMTGVTGISGVMETYSGERLVYSIIMNGFPGSTLSGRRMQDALIQRLYMAPVWELP